MNRKICLLLMALILSSVTSFAQFEQGKKYLSANLSGLNLSYSGAEKWNFDLQAFGGYMIEDNWMVTANAGFAHQENSANTLMLGAGVRYYVSANGLFVGVGATFNHRGYDDVKVNDLMPNVQIGYAFFLSKDITIEPSFFYNQSLKNHSDYSKVGFRIGVGIYL